MSPARASRNTQNEPAAPSRPAARANARSERPARGTARRNVPDGDFRVADMTALAMEPSSLDAVVACYSVFHVPREEHAGLFRRIATWLRPGGYLLASVANSDHCGYTEPDFFGGSSTAASSAPSFAVSSLIQGLVERASCKPTDVAARWFRALQSLPATDPIRSLMIQEVFFAAGWLNSYE